MDTGTLFRRTGAALVVAGAGVGLIAVLGYLDDRLLDESTRWYLFAAPLVPILVLLNFLPGLHERQQKHIDWKGQMGSICTLVGSIGVITALISGTLQPDRTMVITALFFIGGLVLLTGTGFLAACMYTAHVFPRGGGILLALGWFGFWLAPAVANSPLFFVPSLCLLGAAWTWLSHAVAFERPRILSEKEVVAEAFDRR